MVWVKITVLLKYLLLRDVTLQSYKFKITLHWLLVSHGAQEAVSLCFVNPTIYPSPTLLYGLCQIVSLLILLGWLWLSGRTSILLLEVHWSYSPGLHLQVSLGKILNPKLLLMCWLAPCMAATAISVQRYVWLTASRFGQKHLLNALNEPWLPPLLP